jgi:deoxyribodipyrimidine photolyase
VETVVVLFNRELRGHVHPALSAASERARRVIPLFVLDTGILRWLKNRMRCLTCQFAGGLSRPPNGWRAGAR